MRDRKGASNGTPLICSTTSASPGQSTYHLSSLSAPSFVIARALSFITDFRCAPFGLPNHNSRGFYDESLGTSLYIVLRTFDCSVVPRRSHWAYLNTVPTTMGAEVFLPLGNSRFHPSPASMQTVLLISFPSPRLANFPSSAYHVSHTTESNSTTQLSRRPSFYTQHRAAPDTAGNPTTLPIPYSQVQATGLILARGYSSGH